MVDVRAGVLGGSFYVRSLTSEYCIAGETAGDYGTGNRSSTCPDKQCNVVAGVFCVLNGCDRVKPPKAV